MFEKLMREFDRMLDQTEDHIQIVRIMTAEFHLCCRKNKDRQEFIKHTFLSRDEDLV